MSRFPRLIAAVAVTVLLAACGQVDNDPVGPSGPSLDGGVLIGGSNRTEPDSTTSPGAQGQTTTTSGGVPIGGSN